MSQIQWFPGHMAKARRQINEQLALVDVVIEIADARLPESSRNPLLDELIQNKKRILVLNKSDLADAQENKRWVNHFEHLNIQTTLMDAQHNKGLNQLQQMIRKEMAEIHEMQKKKGIKPRAIRLMIVGIPNVGKSTLINRFVGKNQAQTGNKPGVTKQQRWLKISRDFELLDTPGILWPKFEDPDTGIKLAISGAIKDTLLHMDDLALYLIRYLRQWYPSALMDRYPLTVADDELLSDVDVLLAITKKMNLRDNYDEASIRLIHEFRQGLMGRITLDQCEKNYE